MTSTAKQNPENTKNAEDPGTADRAASVARYRDREEAAFVATVTDAEFPAWLARVRHIGGCEDPIHLVGHTVTRDATTGEMLHVFSSTDQPHGRLLVACRNRRISRCVPCSWLYQGDTYQLVVSGVAGGKGIPPNVREHPRAFVTLTAPSFGAVHRSTSGQMPCHPSRARGRGTCEHGRSRSCDQVHGEDERLVGSPLCPACYDYASPALWNARANALWDRFASNLRRHLARIGHVPSSRLGEHLRVSFAKVAEYQRRGAIHFHAVIRLDGPTGPSDAPPVWATLDALTEAVAAARATVWIDTPYSPAVGVVRLRFGEQMDIRPIRAFDGGDELSEQAVASYIAKYVTKGDVAGLLADRPIRHPSAIALLPVTEHAKTLMRTCWRLGGLPEYEGLNLRTWTHQLGYRGHITTKSRVYSTTYTELRNARAAFRRGEEADQDKQTLREARWSFAGHGYSDVEAMFAAEIAQTTAALREVRSDVRASSRNAQK